MGRCRRLEAATSDVDYRPGWMTSTNVSSEIGRLRTVIVHRPGIEIARITPDNKEALLFDDLLWLERAQEEHDRFTQLMEERGVEVLYFENLLRDVLDIEGIRGQIIDDIITPARCGAGVSARLRASIRDAECDRVVDVLRGGLLERELPDLCQVHWFEYVPEPVRI